MKTIIGKSKKYGDKEILVDDWNYDKVKNYVWSIDFSDGTFYARTVFYVDGKRIRYKMHRLIKGVTDPNVKVDHINHNGLDNQEHNLRTANASKSAANRRGWGTSYKGVYFRYNMVYGKVAVNGKQEIVAKYHKAVPFAAELCAVAFDDKVRELHGEFAFTNFPNEVKTKVA